MDWYIQVLLGIVGSGISIAVGYQISDYYRQQEFETLLAKIEELEEEIVGLRNEVDGEPITAAKFRIRTLQADPRRHSRVVNARFRAKRYRTPDPRK
jgi:hypothetical protein